MHMVCANIWVRSGDSEAGMQWQFSLQLGKKIWNSINTKLLGVKTNLWCHKTRFVLLIGAFF